MYESLCQHDKAEGHYKDILKACPNYIDCFLRLGCMLRDRGQIYEASDKFKDALQVQSFFKAIIVLVFCSFLAKHEFTLIRPSFPCRSATSTRTPGP